MLGTKKMLQLSSVATAKTASVYLNRCILENFLSKWTVIVKMTMLINQPGTAWKLLAMENNGLYRWVQLY